MIKRTTQIAIWTAGMKNGILTLSIPCKLCPNFTNSANQSTMPVIESTQQSNTYNPKPPYCFTLNDSHPCAVARLQVMACVPFSLLTYFPLLPCSEIVPSALLIQVNVSQPWKVALLQVMACVPFSLLTYL